MMAALHLLSLLSLAVQADECAKLRTSPCDGHDGSEVHCVLNALSSDDVKFLVSAFSPSSDLHHQADQMMVRCEPWCDNDCSTLSGPVGSECGRCTAPTICRPGAPGYPDSTGLRRRWNEQQQQQEQNSEIQPECIPRDDQGSTCDVMQTSAAFEDEWDSSRGIEAGAVPARIRRRTLPIGAHPRLERIAAHLEALAAAANEAQGWGFELELGGAGGFESTLQLNRYTAGGYCPPHRDALVTEEGTAEVADELGATDLPRGTEREPELEPYAKRVIGIIVQLSTRREDGAAATLVDPGHEYTGGLLQLRLGTSTEPALAQRLPAREVVDVVRRNATRLPAPPCAGDAIFFTGLTVHEVLPIESGTRDSLVWWTLGHARQPASEGQGNSSTWAGRSPWNRELARSARSR